MITEIKNYVIIALIIALAVQTHRFNHARHEYDLKVLEVAKLQNAIDSANALYKKQKDTLRLREQDAAKRAKQSRKHKDEIMNTKVPKDCKKAIKWMITNSHSLSL